MSLINVLTYSAKFLMQMKSLPQYRVLLTFFFACQAVGLGQVGVSLPPVGKETLTIKNGFNYLGIRLHQNALVEDSVATVTPASTPIGVINGVADALVVGTPYIFEINSGNASGAVLEITGFDATADTLVLSDDVSSALAVGDQFAIRPAATLATLFGASNEAGLDSAFVTPGGADEIWLPNGIGGFLKYYYNDLSNVSFTPEWMDANSGQNVDPSTIPIFYPDGVIIVGYGVENTFVVSGTPKLTPTNYVLGQGLNYLGTIFPKGSTLATMFGASNQAGLDSGFGAAGGDQIWIPLGGSSGGFDKYYYDDLNEILYGEGWSDYATGTPINPSIISFDQVSGIIVSNSGAIQLVTAQPPGFYSNL